METAQLRDFLTIYNTMSETCFSQCVQSLNSRKLEPEEIKCVEGCVGKFVKFNHRLMGVYANLQGEIVQRRIKEAEETQAKELEKAAADAQKIEATSNSSVELNNTYTEDLLNRDQNSLMSETDK